MNPTFNIFFGWLTGVIEFILDFAYYYPLFMAYLWMIGALIYYFRWERNRAPYDDPPDLPEYPGVSIIVPCHNEADQVEEVISYLMLQDYPDYEVIAVNDGSTDNTGEILDALALRYPKLRVLHFATNQGKAMGLRMGALMSKNEFLVCIDGDAILDRYAAKWFMSHLLTGPRVAAVTGNPRVRTRSTLLGKIQVGEFSSIIGMIKRSQRVYGRVFTVSGVVAAFRKAALHSVGYWSFDMVTEDIDISWKLQLKHWDVRYEPNALCWILMPETLRGLWKQRVRWSLGGSQVLMRYLPHLLRFRTRRMWPVYLEYFTSVAWTYAITIVFFLWFLGLFIDLPPELYVDSILPSWYGIVLGVTCLLQFTVSFFIDSRYEKGLAKYYYWIVWYPLAFWVINVCTTIVAFPQALFRRSGKRAVWTSPDRGLRAA